MEELKARRDDLSRRVEREENKGLRRLAQIQSLEKSYRYGKRVFMMLKELENVRSNGVFEVVAEQAQVSKVVERPIQPTIVGREKMLETAWNRLMEDEVGMYGMGEWDLDIHKIQEEIAEKLGLASEDWNRKDKDQKACDIHSGLRRKKFVLLLDDIWAKVNITDIGVPFPS